ncbi:MAG: type II secretion system protein GspM [Halioglobus sp.]
MNWLQNNRNTALMVGLTLVIPLILLLYISGNFWMARQGYQQEIDRLEPRVARLRGLVESEEQLQTSVDQMGTRVLSMVYPSSDDSATVSAALQKNVRKLMTQAGLSVSVSRVLPVVEADDFDRIGLSISVVGSLDALDAVLSDIAAYTPLLLVVSIDIKPVPRTRDKSKGGQSVLATLQLLTLRAGL